MSVLGLILSVVVSAQLDSAQLWIGQQSNLVLEAISKGEQVEFPLIGGDLTEGIEVVSQSKIDTIIRKDGTRQLKKQLVITSFKDSLFYIEPFRFVSDGDTILTNGLSLNVIQPFVLDSTDNSITDIKDIQRARIWWWGILLSVVIIGLIILVDWLYSKYGYIFKFKAKKMAEQSEPEVLRPAGEVAIEKLDKIREEKIWQQGRVKDYHTELTDVVREYISRRFSIASQERTSDEILTDMKPILLEQKELYKDLTSILRIADLVKFAKWRTTPEENEQSLRLAYNFVNQTQEVIEDDKEKEEEDKI